MRSLALLLLIPSLSFAFGDKDEAEVICLAENIYHEARGEGYEGMVAVGHVTMNRVESKRFPDSVCGVVRQAKYIKSWRTGEMVPARNRCQFSWYCDGRPEVINEESKEWRNSLMVAAASFYRFDGDDTTDGAMWYHAERVTPYWANSMYKVRQVNNHIFYRQ